MWHTYNWVNGYVKIQFIVPGEIIYWGIYDKRPMKTQQIPEHHHKRLEILGIYLRELRYSEGKTLEQMCLEIPLHRNTLQRAETSKNITLGSLFILADFYDIRVSELLSIIDE